MRFAHNWIFKKVRASVFACLFRNVNNPWEDPTKPTTRNSYSHVECEWGSVTYSQKKRRWKLPLGTLSYVWRHGLERSLCPGLVRASWVGIPMLTRIKCSKVTVFALMLKTSHGLLIRTFQLFKLSQTRSIQFKLIITDTIRTKPNPVRIKSVLVN